MQISPEQYAEQNTMIPAELERCPLHPDDQVRRFIDYRQWQACGVNWLKEMTGVSYECAACSKPLNLTPPN